jgi:AraC-like DNA-binding protein
MRSAAVKVRRKSLFDSGTRQIGTVEMRPATDACGDVERQDLNVAVLPLKGVFSKHDSPSRHVVGTPSHAVFIAAGTPYRIGFPGGIGDRALTLRFGPEVAPELVDRRDGQELSPHGLLPSNAIMLRNLLLARLGSGDADDFEIETTGLHLLDLSLRSVRTAVRPRRRATEMRRTRAVERIKEAVALAPAEKWSVARLAAVACFAPFHLCHVFRETVGISLYDYVLQERLACALDAVLDGGDDLTGIALESGFASHSHFTARFRRFFGCTPAMLRRTVTAGQHGQMRRIMTAQERWPAVA